MVDGALKVYKLKKYIFFNFPKKFSIRDYDIARDEFVNSLKGLNAIKGIVEFGTVTSPGVSDLDFMLIVDDVQKIPKTRIKKITSVGNVKKFVKDGTILTLTSHIFKNIRYIDKFGHFRFLLGKKIENKIPNDIYQQGLDLVSLIDWLPERLLRLNLLLKAPRIDVVNALCLLHSTKYSLINICNKFKLKKNKYNYFSSNVENLRNNWNELPDAQLRLLNTLQLGIQLLMDAIDKLSEVYFHDEISILKKNIKLPSIKLIPFHKSIKLRFQRSFNNKKNRGILFPKVLSYHFWFLASLDCKLSNLISKRIGISFNERFKDIRNIDTPYFIALRKKMDLLNVNYNTLLKSKTSVGMVRYGNYVNL